MTKTILQKMEEVMRRPVPYEGLLGRVDAPYGSRTSAAVDVNDSPQEDFDLKRIELELWDRARG